MNELIKDMRNKGFGLSGSRRMAEKYPHKIILTEGADWDLYCEDSPENREYLTRNGFALVLAENRDYWDDLLVDMYKHTELPVECLVRRETRIYMDAFESLSAEVFLEKLWKSSPLITVTNKIQFSDSVCRYFNGLFRLHGYTQLDYLMF